MEWLDHVVGTHLTFWDIVKFFSKTVVAFYITTSSAWEFQFLQSSPTFGMIQTTQVFSSDEISSIANIFNKFLK